MTRDERAAKRAQRLRDDIATKSQELAQVEGGSLWGDLKRGLIAAAKIVGEAIDRIRNTGRPTT